MTRASLRRVQRARAAEAAIQRARHTRDPWERELAPEECAACGTRGVIGAFCPGCDAAGREAAKGAP